MIKLKSLIKEQTKIAPFSLDIEEATIENENYRKVLWTGEYTQLVLYSLEPLQEIGNEIHDNDQFVRVEAGDGLIVINGTEYEVEDGDSVIVPAGSKHNVINLSDEEPLKLYFLYSPPKHPEGRIDPVKPEETGFHTEKIDKETVKKLKRM